MSLPVQDVMDIDQNEVTLVADLLAFSTVHTIRIFESSGTFPDCRILLYSARGKESLAGSIFLRA